MQRTARMKKEIQMLTESPPFGISCWPTGDNIDRLEASRYMYLFSNLLEKVIIKVIPRVAFMAKWLESLT